MDGQVVSLCSRLLPADIKLVSEIRWDLVADFGMAADTIVEHLNVLEDHLPCLLAGCKVEVIQALCLECVKEAFHWCGALSQQFPFRLVEVVMP